MNHDWKFTAPDGREWRVLQQTGGSENYYQLQRRRTKKELKAAAWYASAWDDYITRYSLGCITEYKPPTPGQEEFLLDKFAEGIRAIRAARQADKDRQERIRRGLHDRLGGA